MLKTNKVLIKGLERKAFIVVETYGTVRNDHCRVSTGDHDEATINMPGSEWIHSLHYRAER